MKRLWSLTAAAVVSSSVLAAVGPFAAQADTAKQAGAAAKQVALRPAIEALGGQLAWDQTTKSVKVLVRDAELLVTPGKDEVTVDGQTQRMPAPAEMSSDSQTYVPEAFITDLMKHLNSLRITHGVASGDVSAKSAIIWGRSSSAAQMHVEYATDPGFAGARAAEAVAATPAADYTAKVKLDGLKPGTLYHYRVWFTGTATDGTTAKTAAKAGTFRTLQEAGKSQPLSFVVWGDLGGQEYCRRVDTGYDIFAKMQALKPDFAIANGDSIYADGHCPADGTGGWKNIPGNFPRIDDPSVDWTNLAQVTDNYQKHWKYHRKDPNLELLMSSVPSYTQWDDHEITNDAGGQWLYQNEANKDRAGYPNLVTAGTDSFFNYSPIERNKQEPNRIYRSFNMGKEADLFVLDARSYRSRNDLKDTPENQKTMLGKEQLAWLKESLLKSKATWKVITSDIPEAFQTGGDKFGRDAWATDPATETGFEREQLELMKFLDEHEIKNVVFLATDVHYTANVRFEKDLNGDGKPLVFHELVTGPVNAVRGGVGKLSPTLNPKLLYSEGKLFNFGYVQIRPGADGKSHLLADVRGVDGQVRPGSELDLTPQGGNQHDGNQQDGNQQDGNH